jgi:hypothetical protein
MTERFEVPCGAMWSLAAERATHIGYSYAAGADGPLSRDEIAQFGQELGARAERWRIACDLHWLDLRRFHSRGWR